MRRYEFKVGFASGSKPGQIPGLRERLAAVQHDIWSNWMNHFFSCCEHSAYCHVRTIGTMLIQYSLGKLIGTRCYLDYLHS